MGRSITVATIPRIIPVKGLSAAEAATFIGIGETFFHSLVAEGKMPRPRVFGKRRLWDIDELAAAFKATPMEGETQGSSWDDWKRG